MKIFLFVLTRKRLGCWSQFDTPLWFLQECNFKQEGDTLVFVTYNIIISHIFPENFIEISKFV